MWLGTNSPFWHWILKIDCQDKQTNSLLQLRLLRILIQPVNKKVGKFVKLWNDDMKSYALSFYRSQNILCRSKFFVPAQKFDCIYALSFYRSQNVLGWCKFFVPDQKFIYVHIVAITNILCQTKRWFAFSKIGFCASTKVFEEALNAVKFLGWLKKFGPAQNILVPVKGQGINLFQNKIKP